MDEAILKEIESAKKRLKEKHNFEFPIPIIIVDDSGGHVDEKGVFIGRKNPLMVIEVMVIHEAYHIILEIDQVVSGSFAEKNNGNIMPYFEEEMIIWNRMRVDFPELATPIYICVEVERQYVKNFRKEWESKKSPESDKKEEIN